MQITRRGIKTDLCLMHSLHSLVLHKEQELQDPWLEATARSGTCIIYSYS